MGWATTHIQRLASGERFQFRAPGGNSMLGKISPGDTCHIEPATADSVNVGDIVLCKVSGNQYLHIVKAKNAGGECQIANNRGRVNGWTKAIYGKVTAVVSA